MVRVWPPQPGPLHDRHFWGGGVHRCSDGKSGALPGMRGVSRGYALLPVALPHGETSDSGSSGGTPGVFLETGFAQSASAGIPKGVSARRTGGTLMSATKSVVHLPRVRAEKVSAGAQGHWHHPGLAGWLLEQARWLRGQPVASVPPSPAERDGVAPAEHAQNEDPLMATIELTTDQVARIASLADGCTVVGAREGCPLVRLVDGDVVLLESDGCLEPANASCSTSSAAIALAQNTCWWQIERARRLWSDAESRRVPSRTALGTVRPPASAIGGTVTASEAHGTHPGPSPRTASTTSAINVASMTRAISRFIGRAEVVTRR